MTEEEAAAAPASVKTKDAMTGMPGHEVHNGRFYSGLHRLRLLRKRLPGGEKGEQERSRYEAHLRHRWISSQVFDYAVSKVAEKPEVREKFKENTVKGAQFKTAAA